jgi:hypothetical protein
MFFPDHPAIGKVARPVAKPVHGSQLEAAPLFGGKGVAVDCSPLTGGA